MQSHRCKPEDLLHRVSLYAVSGTGTCPSFLTHARLEHLQLDLTKTRQLRKCAAKGNLAFAHVHQVRQQEVLSEKVQVSAYSGLHTLIKA